MWRALLFAGVVVASVLLVFVDVVVAPGTFMPTTRSFRVKIVQDMLWIRDGIEACADANDGRYPETLHEILPYVEGWWLPSDPWKETYVYVPSPGGGPYALFTFGSDRWPGGEGEDADFEVHPGAPEPHLVRDCPHPSGRGAFHAGYIMEARE